MRPLIAPDRNMPGAAAGQIVGKMPFCGGAHISGLICRRWFVARHAFHLPNNPGTGNRRAGGGYTVDITGGDQCFQVNVASRSVHGPEEASLAGKQRDRRLPWFCPAELHVITQGDGSNIPLVFLDGFVSGFLARPQSPEHGIRFFVGLYQAFFFREKYAFPEAGVFALPPRMRMQQVHDVVADAPQNKFPPSGPTGL